MKALRHLGFALWLALALVAGQQLALLHELGHATEQLAQKQDSKPAPSKCDQHYATGQLVGAASCGFAAPLAANHGASFAFVDLAVHAPDAPAYRSRAPPQLL